MNPDEAIKEERPSFSQRLRSGLRSFAGKSKNYYLQHPKLLYLFCFLLPTFLMTLIYALMQVYPFGGSSVLVLDLNGQYVYFFEGLRDLIYGNGSVLYSFSRAMGGEFMGMYAYYLASPFSYLVALFPKESITEALFFMFVLKCGCCGLTMGIYLDRIVHTERTTSVIFSTLYALSMFAVVMQHNTMWTDNLILLPLVAIGIEEMIRNRKYKLYTVSLTLAVISNFYIGYMMCLFVVIYCAYAYFGKTREERNPRGERFHFPRCLGQILLFSMIALMIAALIWIPTYYSLQFGKDSFDGSMGNETYYAFTTKFDLFDLFPKLFFGSYDTVDYPGLPFVYCGTLAILALPFFFLRKDVLLRKKLMSVLAAGILIFSFNINLLDKIWHGFQAPNWLNYRYAFMLVFLLLIMAAKGFDDLRSHSPRTVLAITAVFAVLLCFSDFFDNEHINFLLMTVPSLLFLIATASVMIFLLHKKKIRFRIASLAMLLLITVEMTCAGVANLYMLHQDVVITKRSSYRDFMDRWQPAVDYVQANDDGFYRMEKTVARKYNDAFGLGYRGLSGSTSTLNAETVRFLADMGLTSYSHHTAYQRPMPVLDSFFSLKYILTETKEATSGSWASTKVTGFYELVDTVGPINVYRNPYALPIAFCVSPEINTVTFISPEERAKAAESQEKKESNSPLSKITSLLSSVLDVLHLKKTDSIPDVSKTYVDTKQPCVRYNAMFSAMLGKETNLLIPMEKASENEVQTGEYAIHGTNVRLQYYSNYNLYTATGDEASISFTFRGMGDNEVYFYAPLPSFSSYYMKRVSLYLDGSWLYSYYTSTEYGFVDLGAFPDDEEHTLELRIRDKSIYLGKTESYLYYLDKNVFQETFGTLQENGISLERYTEDSFLGTVNVPEGQTTVLTTLAYDPGWNVRIDGETVIPYKTLDALLAFDITPGEHTVEMVYFPACYRTAIIFFAIGVLLFASIVTAEFVIKRKKNGKRLSCSCAETEKPTTGDAIISNDSIDAQPANPSNPSAEISPDPPTNDTN